LNTCIKQAQEFGLAFVDAHGPEEVTTKKFANYALEGKHSTIIRILAYSTSGFSYGPAEAAQQELCALL